jgi:O-antigen ligase
MLASPAPVGASLDRPRMPLPLIPAADPRLAADQPLAARWPSPWRALAAPAGATLLFWLFAGHVLTIWALALSNLLLGLMLLTAMWQWRRLDWRWPETAVLWVPAGCFAIFFVVATLFSLELGTSIGELKDLVSFATLLIAPAAVRGEAQVRAICRWMMLVMAALALHGIGQSLFADYGPLHRRIVGMFSHYQTLAGVLLIGLLLICARLALDRRSSRWTWLAGAIVLSALVLGLTRGAWVAAALTLGGLALTRVRRFLPVYLGVAALLALFLFFLAPTSWLERAESISDLKDVSNYDRLCMIDAGLAMIDERPFFGLGPEVVEARYPLYRHPTAPRIAVPHLHNAFLQRTAEQGLVSLAAYAWLMIAGLGLAFSRFRAEGGMRGHRADLYLAVIAIVIGFNIASLFEDNWRDTEVRRLFLFFLALPLCLRPPGDEENAADDR